MSRTESVRRLARQVRERAADLRPGQAAPAADPTPAARPSAPRPAPPSTPPSTTVVTAIAAARATGRTLDLGRCAYGTAVGGRYLDTPRAYYYFLAGLARVTGARTVLEIGTHFGGSALALSIGQVASGAGANVLTLDVEDRAGDVVRGEPGVRRLLGDLRDPEVFEQVRQWCGGAVDLVYIDALKDEQFLLEMVDAVAPLTPAWTVCDDIAANASIGRAWSRIAAGAGDRATTVDDVAADIRERPYGQGVLATADALAALPADLGATTVRAAWGGLVTDGEYGTEDDGLGVAAMMRPRERALLRRATRDLWSGGGEIVDAGAFVGASTVALAGGLAERSDVPPGARRVHSYDLFLKTNRSHQRLIGDEIAKNESFEPVFHRNLGELATRVNVYAGDFASMRWIGRPIEIFFADVAKSPALDAHVYAEFGRWWVPGLTLYVQQDFVHAEAPWVQISIGALLDHFEILGVEAPSLVLGLSSPLDPAVVARIVAQDFTKDEQVANVLRLHDAIADPETKATMLLVAARVQLGNGRPGRAKALLARCRGEYGQLPDKAFQARIRATKAAIAEDAAG